jgi:integrase
MRQAGHDRHGLRIRALIAVLWRAGLPVSEALALNETDIDQTRGSVLVRHGKGDKRREADMDQFGFEQLTAWQAHRVLLPPGPLFCVIDPHIQHTDLGTTSTYLQGIDPSEIIDTVRSRRPPTISMTAGLSI